jgi:hypothetical protein
VGRASGFPHTEALRVTERYHRRDFGHVDVQITFDDAKTFARPWTATSELLYDPDTELLEYVCNENEKSLQHYVQTKEVSAITVDPALLAKYAGVYQMMTPRGMANATVTVDAGQLMIDVPGLAAAAWSRSQRRCFNSAAPCSSSSRTRRAR